MSGSDACALNADGSLKDAKDIVFYNDPDDTVPLPPSAKSAPPSAKSAAAPTDAFLVLLKAGCKPAPLTAGAQHSIHTSKFSARLRDADNACSNQVSSLTSRKHARALSSTTTEPPVTKKVVLQLSAPLSDDDDSHVTGAESANTDHDTDTNDAPAEDQPEDEDEQAEPEDATIRTTLSKSEAVLVKS
ncbi:hypothetical protein DFJ58DRAFT_728185 [Suillus subalutaceus]|uniref:uncharacterized protein n=1 Tax=Suillus subalutaceus TaxID=48586 RepID=UPI001B87991E|nr:uncharacterized protein DFJ58DRAFT_728185 [Suillus subalutaceus]KAG1853440.1 hypothetical protein DFJ58DRAFT_728185 [Suillus subalutaceus]